MAEAYRTDEVLECSECSKTFWDNEVWEYKGKFYCPCCMVEFTTISGW